MTQPTPALPSDWPSQFVMLVKDEAATYAADLRGDWPDSQTLRDRGVSSVLSKIDLYPDTLDAADDSWVDRWEAGALEAEIASALDSLSSAMLAALSAT
jgi:hypothetical protein